MQDVDGGEVGSELGGEPAECVTAGGGEEVRAALTVGGGWQELANMVVLIRGQGELE